MSRAETLAGLTEAIARHTGTNFGWTMNPEKYVVHRCICGQWETPVDEGAREAHAAHVAAVALAWLEGQMREERTMRMEAFDTPYGRGSGSVWYARRVTAWAPVETGDAPDA